MRITTRIVTASTASAVAAVVAMATQTGVADASSPAAAPEPLVTAAVSCYGGAVKGDFYNSGEFGPYRTTSRCGDINLRANPGIKDPTQVMACVVFVDHTTECNSEKRVGTSWKVIASDVRDGTRFKVIAWAADGEHGLDHVEIAF